MSATKLLWVEWIDSIAPADCAWMSGEEIAEFTTREKLIEDCGWLVEESRDYISLCGGMSEEPSDSCFASMYHRLIRIPKCAIRRRKDLTRFIPK